MPGGGGLWEALCPRIAAAEPGATSRPLHADPKWDRSAVGAVLCWGGCEVAGQSYFLLPAAALPSPHSLTP